MTTQTSFLSSPQDHVCQPLPHSYSTVCTGDVRSEGPGTWTAASSQATITEHCPSAGLCAVKGLCRTARQLPSAALLCRTLDLQSFSLYVVPVGEERQSPGCPLHWEALSQWAPPLSPWPHLTTRRVVGNVGFHWVLFHPLKLGSDEGQRASSTFTLRTGQTIPYSMMVSRAGTAAQ